MFFSGCVVSLSKKPLYSWEFNLRFRVDDDCRKALTKVRRRSSADKTSLGLKRAAAPGRQHQQPFEMGQVRS